MARDLKFDGPLSIEGRKYLADRGRYPEIARWDQEFPPDGEAPDLEDVNAKTMLQGGKSPELEPFEAFDDDDLAYEEWTVADLVEELKRRGLPSTGKKPELVDRLRQNDEQSG